MFKNKRIVQTLAMLMLLVIGLSSCKSKFEKLRASNDTGRKYQEAIRYYNDKKFSKALVLFDDLVKRYRGRPEAEDLNYYFAYTNFQLKDYTTARYQFQSFTESYPGSQRAEECRYMAAYCYYLESPVYSLDQENTLKAIEALQLFINIYPNSERAEEAANLIDNLRGKLERKSYENSKIYLDIGDYLAAVIAFDNSLRDYPDTKYAEQLEYYKIEAQYLYALNSSERRQEERFNDAIEFADDFAADYPESAHLDDALKFKSDSEKGIERVRKTLEEWSVLQEEAEARRERLQERSKSEELIEETPVSPEG
ncbi:outer membrane protein assembly factor BamD [Albibacterium indicum]|uniref:outer membrane protein assembly factor BamD n=1 Tax=Albibacterium indicum TaxID=2292082 RepID=UPI000E4FB52E|nr:outer membrane protein assembly factor BamD [Pedobacter indicus]